MGLQGDVTAAGQKNQPTGEKKKSKLFSRIRAFFPECLQGLKLLKSHQFCYHLATLCFNFSNSFNNLQANRLVETQNMLRGTKTEGDSTGHLRGSPGEPLKHSPSPPYNAPNDSLQNTKWLGNPRQKQPAVTG